MTDEYKQVLKNDEQEYDAYIILDDGTKIDTDLSGFKPIYNLGQRIVGNFANKRVEFTVFNTSKYNLTDQEFEAFVGLKVGNEFVYNSIGKYIANKSQIKDEALDESSVVCNDISIKFKTKYTPVIQFPCKIRVAVKAICDHLNVGYIDNEFINADYVLNEFYIDEDATFHDVMKTLATAGFANAIITYENKLIMKSPSMSVDYKFDLNELFELKKEDNIFGPLNSIVASRIVADDGSTTEDIYARDETSITANGLYEYKIKQNEAIDYDRQTAVNNMLAGILNFKYVPTSIEAVYNPMLEIGNMLEVPDKNTDTSFLLFAKELTADLMTGLMIIESTEDTKTETDYKNATQKDKRTKTELEVSKLKGKITLLSSQVSETEKELDSISTPIALFAGKSGTIESAESNLDLTEVRGESTQDGTPATDNPVEIKSVTSPVTITSTGKNLLNEPSSLTVATVKANVQLNVKAGTYVLSVENIETTGTTASLVLFNLADGTTDYYYLSNSSKSKIVTFNSDITSYNIYSQNSYSASIDVTAVFTNLMLRQENTSAEYEPHVSNQANIDLLHPLRNLPNGTYDRIYKLNGKWYDEQKVKTVTYSGTETGWVYYSGQDKDNTVFFQRIVEDRATTYGYKTVPVLCDRLVNRGVYGIDQEGIYLQSSNGVLMVRLNRSRLSEISLAGFLEWLAENNLEVQYELAAPISTEITYASIITELENIKTYKGITNIMSDAYIEANYYINNSLNAEYVNKFESEKQNKYVTEKLAKIELTNEQIEQTVASNKIASDNDKQELLQKFDNYAPANEITRVENKVTQLQTDTYTKTQIDTKLTDGSVTMVKSTIALLNDAGFTIEKSGAPTKSNMDANGWTIKDTTSGTEENLLEAIYDNSIGETLVRSKNMYATKYLVAGKNSRVEDYMINRTGAFYIGG